MRRQSAPPVVVSVDAQEGLACTLVLGSSDGQRLKGPVSGQDEKPSETHASSRVATGAGAVQAIPGVAAGEKPAGASSSASSSLKDNQF